MKKRLEELITLKGVEVGDDVEEELNDVIKDNSDEISTFPPGNGVAGPTMMPGPQY